MSETERTLRAQLSGAQPAADGLVDAVADRIGPDESLAGHLSGTKAIEHDDEVLATAPGGRSLALATDEKLVFAAEAPSGPDVVDVPYLNVRQVETTGGFFTTTLAVEVWARGTYEFTPQRGSDASSFVETVEELTESWQRTVAAVEDAETIADELAGHVAAGDRDAAAKARDRLEEKLDRAERIAAAAPNAPVDPLEERIETTRRSVARTRTDGRMERAATLVEEARQQTDATAYTDAYRRYARARTHLETALVAALEWDFGVVSEIQDRIERIDSRLEQLRVRPIALAKQARERALKTDRLSVAVEARQAALEHYRDALTAGWGTDIEFAGGTEELREQIEIVVAELIDGRHELAEQALDQAAADAAAGRDRRAQAACERAREQLAGAIDLARQFVAGDADALRERWDELAAVCPDVDSA